MTNEEIADLIITKIKNAKVEVNGDGYHYNLKVITTEFAGKTQVKRQQMIYQILQSYITSGELHAVSIKALSPEEVV